jgi:hypothetical protein
MVTHLQEENIMAAFIKRILDNARTENHHKGWADYKEQQQFELERQQWASSQWLRTV